jgi:hypothetical protein
MFNFVLDIDTPYAADKPAAQLVNKNKWEGIQAKAIELAAPQGFEPR